MHGDLEALFHSIKLAVKRYEAYDTSDLKGKFFGLTMKKDGENNLMKFLATVDNILARLSGVGEEMSEKDMMSTLRRGVHQEIFASIVDLADAGTYNTYDEIKSALLAKSTKTNVMAKLIAIDADEREHTLMHYANPKTEEQARRRP